MADNLEYKYVCSLDQQSIERAKAELNEDEKNRDGAVQTLREWVLQQQWLRSPTDTGFLLRYLRCHKFSQLSARRVLDNYWTVRTKDPSWFADLDPRDSIIQDILSTGFLLKLPGVDKHGRLCVMQRPGVLDLNWVQKIGAVNIFRAFTIMRDWLAMDERAQVNGVVLTGDFTGYTMQHRSVIFTTENMKKFILSMQDAYPLRIKSLNMYNMPPLFEAVLAIIKSFMKPKLKDRIHVHGKSLVSFYKEVEMSVLPTEYLPDDYTGPSAGSIQSIIDQMKKDIVQPEVVNHITKLTSSNYGVDLSLKPDNTPTESFRKLNVD